MDHIRTINSRTSSFEKECNNNGTIKNSHNPNYFDIVIINKDDSNVIRRVYGFLYSKEKLENLPADNSSTHTTRRIPHQVRQNDN